MVTQTPPKANSPEQMTNRNPKSSIFPNAQQPLVSSRIPESTTCTSEGKAQKIHRFPKAKITRNRTTHPHTLAMALMADWRANGNVTGWHNEGVRHLPLFPGRSIPTSTALVIWINQSSHTVRISPKAGPIIPNRKEGPALEQNPIILRASCLLSCPCLKAEAML